MNWWGLETDEAGTPGSAGLIPSVRAVLDPRSPTSSRRFRCVMPVLHVLLKQAWLENAFPWTCTSWATILVLNTGDGDYGHLSGRGRRGTDTQDGRSCFASCSTSRSDPNSLTELCAHFVVEGKFHSTQVDEFYGDRETLLVIGLAQVIRPWPSLMDDREVIGLTVVRVQQLRRPRPHLQRARSGGCPSGSRPHRRRPLIMGIRSSP